MDFELKNAPSVEERKLVASGASIVITLPKKWLEENKLKAGSEVIVVANGDLQILNKNKENVERLNKKISSLRNQLACNNNQTDSVTSGRNTGQGQG
jgi:bifunctional DNA-binding transcriptional regulator/antitoxin component of YhaV-PrlF toxin-antitoxin module